MATADAESPLLFCERPEWSDVTPILQYENIAPLAPIFYNDQYKDATDYFRGIVKSGEMSPRVLDLTESIIRMNPAHYSAWTYRYRTLTHLQLPLEPELVLTNNLTKAYLKTYQVWHHRRLLITALHTNTNTAPVNELAFVETILDVDAKNYHTWSYRQWLLSHFDREEMWGGEVAFVESMVDEDVRNNSAWHHRFFVVFERRGKEKAVDADVVRGELLYTKQKIALAPNNMSSWNYLRGILNHAHIPYSDLTSFVEPYTTTTPPSSEDEVVDLENPLPSKGAQLPCSAAIEFLADIYEKEGASGLDRAVELWKSLADEHDKIRKKYWEYRIKEASANVSR